MICTATILPPAVPEVHSLRIAVAYRPMAAVAGDFYEFIPVDGKRVGFLVADVAGHGVPAALIASMIKVAMQSVVTCAHEPREVLRGLNRILVLTVWTEPINTRMVDSEAIVERLTTKTVSKQGFTLNTAK